jgi:hypothetical protein
MLALYDFKGDAAGNQLSFSENELMYVLAALLSSFNYTNNGDRYIVDKSEGGWWWGMVSEIA